MAGPMWKLIHDPNRSALGDVCVLGGTNAMAQLTQGAQVEWDLQNYYVQDYIKRWRDFAAATSVEPFRSAADAAKKLELLADNRSPLLAAIFMISENTNFPASSPGNSVVACGAAGSAAEKSGLLNLADSLQRKESGDSRFRSYAESGARGDAGRHQRGVPTGARSRVAKQPRSSHRRSEPQLHERARAATNRHAAHRR